MESDLTSKSSADETRVLLLPPTSRDADAIQKILASERISCVVCPDVQTLCNRLTRGVGVLLISEEALIADPDELIACIRGQPVWSDLPTIVLSRWGAETPRLIDILSQFGNVSVVERPVRVTTLLSLVRSSLRARMRQYQVRAHFAELEAAEQDLRGSEERLRLALQTGKLGVWELDLQTREMSCSATFKANFGRAADDPFTDADLWSAIHPDDVDRVQTAVGNVIAQRSDYDIEYRNIWPDGSTHWVLARARPAVSFGKPVRLVGVTLDITERKNAEELRAGILESERAARATAERAGRMKDEFLATLSHELRTPLNAILGWSHILAKNSRDEKGLAEGLRTIERNARAQTQIIEDLLDMSRIISGKVRLDIQRISLAPVVEAAIETVRPAAEAKGVRLEIALDPLAGPVRGDPNRLQQVFWNLLSNAVKFTPRDQRVQVVLERANSQLEVSVIDTGEGINPDFLPHVFDRFRQADASTTRHHGGLGLGLAIVKQLVELHGGSARVTSPGVGKGATFTVSLPITAVHAEPRNPVNRRHPAAVTNAVEPEVSDDIAGVRALVVDDEPDSRALIRRLLEDRKGTVVEAASTSQAIELVQTFHPDVLISDIGMPGDDGYSLIRRLRALTSEQGGQTPAIALTAYARAEDRINAVRAGFQQHVAKPVEPAELIAVVASLVRPG